MKPVLFVIIDALDSGVVVPEVRAGRLPALAAIAERGTLREQCLSIFPSITPAATAALATGRYPDQTGIAGAFWYDSAEHDVAYFGDEWKAIRNLGVDAYLRGFLTGLNYDRLACDSVYELCADGGRTSASLNLMWFRGRAAHSLFIPAPFRLLTSGDLPESIDGPDVLFIGDFVHHDARTDTAIEVTPRGFGGRYGFNDAATADALDALLTPGATPPDLTVAYFPDNDFRSHDVGPEAAVDVVREVDRRLTRLMDAHGGPSAFLDRFAVVVTGDHSQIANRPGDGAAIDLDAITHGFRVTAGGADRRPGDDILVGVNMRAANVYFGDALPDRPVFIKQVLKDERVDQAAFRGEDGRIEVQTADRGTLRFRPSPGGARDDYGGTWAFDGDLSTVDARVEAGRLRYGEYPNAFERLWTGCTPVSGDLWLTARPGYEFEIPETSAHPGGAHGSLHRGDSVAPLITAGLDCVDVPDVPRIVDVVPMIAMHLGLPFEFSVGQGRVPAPASEIEAAA